jgi:hypothetical protein
VQLELVDAEQFACRLNPAEAATAICLDFTEAVITQPLLRITAEVTGGGSG